MYENCIGIIYEGRFGKHELGDIVKHFRAKLALNVTPKGIVFVADQSVNIRPEYWELTELDEATRLYLTLEDSLGVVEGRKVGILLASKYKSQILPRELVTIDYKGRFNNEPIFDGDPMVILF